MKHRVKTTVCLGLLVGLVSGSAYAGKDVYRPQVTTTQWGGTIRESPIGQIHVYLRKVSGSDTFVNLRFGREGHTFDGRRVQDGNGWNEYPHYR